MRKCKWECCQMVVLHQGNKNCHDRQIEIEIIRLQSQDNCSPFPSLLPRAESDLAEVISAADREVGSLISTIWFSVLPNSEFYLFHKSNSFLQRILETGRTMMETSMTSLPSPEECRWPFYIFKSSVFIHPLKVLTEKVRVFSHFLSSICFPSFMQLFC